MKKFITILAVFLVCSILPLAAQQSLTKFGVIDTARVYNTYFRNSTGVRNYEKKKTDFQAEVDKLSEELKTLQQQKVNFEKAGDTASSERVEAQIKTKTEFITEYTRTKNIELEQLRSNLETSDTFYSSLYSIIEKIAEAQGLSLILSLQQANAVLWYSPSVDITEQVIDALGSQ